MSRAARFRWMLLLLLGLSSVPFLTGQEERFEFYPAGTYDRAVPTPAAVLGYEIGQRITSTAGVERYLGALEKATPKVRTARYGESGEGIPLPLVIISAPENLKNLAVIQAQTRRLADSRGFSSKEAAALASRMPATVWLSAGVHGDEVSGSEVALQLAYQLAAGTDRATQKILKECVVVMTPVQNPDGRERFISTYSAVAGPEPNEDSQAAEHDQPWPTGRGNHYYFDLNRDWFFLTQPETRSALKLYQEYFPQVFVDLHEMSSGGTYYFAPPARPLNKNLPPQTQQWWTLYGRNIASVFDRLGLEYFTRESYDEFYPGYGSSWPLYHGATGMTFEQASPRGIRFRRGDDQALLTLRDAVWHHFVATLSVLQTTADNREKRLQDFYEFHRTAIEEGKSENVKAYVFTAQKDRWQAEKLARNLLLQGVEVFQTGSEQKVDLRDLLGDKAASVRLPAGAYVVPMAQPSKRLIKAIFEREAELDAEFFREEQRRLQKKEPTQIYDVTAWSVPLYYGLEAGWINKVPGGLRKLAAVPAPGGAVTGGRAAYAYLVPYRTNAEARALADLLKSQHRVQISRAPFKTEGRQFDRGTLILKVAGSAPELHQKMEEVARKYGAAVYAAQSGWVDEGSSLGSGSVAYLKPPRIAVLMDQEVASTSYGSLRFLLEQEYEYPHTPLRSGSFSRVKLKDYDVLVLPDGSAAGYLRLFGKDGIDRIKAWVREGGVLIAIKGGAVFAADKQTAMTTAYVEARAPVETTPGAGDDSGNSATGVDGASSPAADRPEEEARERPLAISGALLMARTDDRTYLTLGYPRNVPVLVSSSIILSPSRQGNNAMVYETIDKVHVSGLVWPETRNQIAEKAYLVDETLGAGHVILFAEDPNFRASLDSLNRLMLNALFLAPSQRTYLQDR